MGYSVSVPNFECARRYALNRLSRELSPSLFYHSLPHTRDDVAPAVERLAALDGVDGAALLLLRTAAYYHDIGFVMQRDGHEAVGARIAAAALPRFGYTPEQIGQISGMILATKLPQSPQNRLEELLADADLDNLGREDFLARNQALRAELAAFGSTSADEQWYSAQLVFLTSHHYWTVAARGLRDAQKQRNIEALYNLLASCRKPTIVE